MNADNGTVIYRELGDPPAVLLTWLDERGQLFNVVDDNQNEHLYVDGEQPRDAAITPMIVENTIGFSLFTEDGQRLADYSRLDRAIRAQEGAKLVITPEVDLEDDMPAEDEPPMSALEAALRERIAKLEGEASPVEDEDAEA
jgi:hypothetical protein